MIELDGLHSNATCYDSNERGGSKRIRRVATQSLDDRTKLATAEQSSARRRLSALVAHRAINRCQKP